MPVRDILLLGEPRLYEVCTPVQPEEVDALRPVVQDLHDTMMAFRRRYGAGRAIAAPQIGVMKRLVYMNLPTGPEQGEPVVFINPVLDRHSEAMMTLWDDCMSFPGLLVRLRRHQRCRITYRNLDWQEHRRDLDGPLSELLQHECDHLDGILAVARAIDARAFALRETLSAT